MLGKFLIEDTPVDPVVTLVFNSNWIEFTVRYVTDYRNRRLTKDGLFTRILDAFGETDGRVVIASTTIQLVDLPPISVQLASATPNDQRMTSAQVVDGILAQGEPESG